MRETIPSRTAAWVAAARTLGSGLPPELQLADDPYGIAFGGKIIPAISGVVPSHVLTKFPGLREWVLYMQVRTRVLDDAVRDFAARGGDQIVVLGAGYDCRALRLPEIAAAAIFEVDHPATQAHKREVLDGIGVVSPARYLAWQFLERPMGELPAALAELGHEPSRPTLTIWEGVTMYLNEASIDASVRAVGDYSAPGSVLAMTYFLRRQIARPPLLMRALQVVLSTVGEPWTWGWEPDALPGWMAARGFTVTRDVGMDRAARDLLPEGHRIDASDRRVAIAEKEAIAIASRP
jgi:methyltransferase (TIGR00027 family)